MEDIANHHSVCLAVLPFDNLSGSADHDYFSSEFVEDLITDLSHFNNLQVISSYSGRKIGGEARDAIDEAKTEYPGYNWMHLDRPRFKGAEGGWQNHIPSGVPELEVIIILSTMKLAQKCDSLVCGRSGFSMLLWGYMQHENGTNATKIEIKQMK